MEMLSPPTSSVSGAGASRRKHTSYSVTYLAGAVLLLGSLLLVQSFYQSYQFLLAAGGTRSILFWEEEDGADTSMLEAADESFDASLHQRLTHVVMPFHLSQLDKVRANLRTWTTRHYPPCEPPLLSEEDEAQRKRIIRERPTMVFHVSYSAKDGNNQKVQQESMIVQQCRDAWRESLPLWMRRDCFDNNIDDDGVEVVTLGLTQKDDRHVQGARLMFEEMLRGGVTQTTISNDEAKGNNTTASNAHYALYMEPDMLPIRSNWLHRVQQHVAALPSEFWILGSIYRGDLREIHSTGYLPNKYHINGNSVYNLRSDAFRKFYFGKLRPYIEAAHGGDSVNAYDTDVYEYLHTALENYDTARHIMHYFVYTDLLQNQWHTAWSAKQLAAAHPNTVLVHGGTNTDSDSEDDGDDDKTETTDASATVASAATPS